MSFELTKRALVASRQIELRPQLVLEVEGVSTLFGAVTILETVRVGAPGLLVGGDWRIGGLAAVLDQADIISLTGTGTQITQQLQPEKGAVASVSSVVVALNDRELLATKLISPGVLVPEILGQRATLWMGYKNTSFKEDYLPIFAGVIDDVESGTGLVKLNLAHPDQKKRQEIFFPLDALFDGIISEFDTTVPVADASALRRPVNGPTGSPDASVKYYIRIQDEIIEYTGISGNDLTGCVRGALATAPVQHTTKQVTEIVCREDKAKSLAGKYFFINKALDATQYVVWFKVDGTGTAPVIGGTTTVEVDIAENAPAFTVAGAVLAALNGTGDFNAVAATYEADTVIVTNVGKGKTAHAKDHNTDFALNTQSEGCLPVLSPTFISLEGTACDLALKIMLSGRNGYYLSALPASRFLHPTPATTVPNSIFFEGVDLKREHGVAEGDYITVASATESGNNCTLKQISQITVSETGTSIVVLGVSFVSELESTALVSFRSQYDSLGEGLALHPVEVDVEEHVFWNEFLLSNFSYRFVFTDNVNGKDFLDKQVYLPIGAYSLPRKGRCSMGYHVGPPPRGAVKILSRDNIKNPDQIKIRRTVNRNYFNTIATKFEQEALAGKFLSGVLEVSEESKNRVRMGAKTLVIESKGMRRDLDGVAIAAQVSERYLARYQFAAEYIEAIGVLFRDGATVEAGDVVVLDGRGLGLSNTQDGTREKPAKAFSVMNTKLDMKTGDVAFTLVDTNFSGTERYGAISPSSEIVSGSTTSLLVRDSFGAIYPGNETRKWLDYFGLKVTVHSPDWSYSHDVILLGLDPANGYGLLLDPSTPLPSAPLEGYILDLAAYPDTEDASDQALAKSKHAYLSPNIPIVIPPGGGGGPPPPPSFTSFKIAAADAIYLHAGDTVVAMRTTTPFDSHPIEIGSVTPAEPGYALVTLASAAPVAMSVAFELTQVGFPDRGKPYLFF